MLAVIAALNIATMILVDYFVVITALDTFAFASNIVCFQLCFCSKTSFQLFYRAPFTTLHFFVCSLAFLFDNVSFFSGAVHVCWISELLNAVFGCS